MKKNRIIFRWGSGRWKKVWFMLKLTFVFLFAGIFQLYARSQTITVDLKDVALNEVIWAIEKQTDFVFLYSKEDLEKAGKVSVSLKQETVEGILKECLKGTGLTYVMKAGVIVLRPQQEEKQAVREIEVLGVVKDENGYFLPGVTILLKGTTLGVVTDVNGRFRLQVPASENMVLIFSFVGMKTQEVVYKGEKELNITMKEEVGEMDEVVVTGYQTIAREKVTGSASTISLRQLEERYTPNILDNLEGRVAGLVTYGNKTLIRGTSSMHAETSPLLVVDGLPVEGKIEDLNPYDIENVTVLKDAAAAAIYGARASNGIIVITTKKAKNEGTEINFSGNLTIYEKKNMDYHDNFYMNPQEQVEKESKYYTWWFSSENTRKKDPIGSFENDLGSYGAISPLKYAYYQYAKGMIGKNELEELKNELKQNNFAKEYGEHALRRQFLQQYNLALRTKTDKFNQSLVFNLKRDNNGIIHSHDNQVNISYRGSYDMKKWLTVGFNFNGVVSKDVESNSEYATDPFNVPAYYSLLNKDGSYNYYSVDFNQYYTKDDEEAGLQTMNFNHLEELNFDKTTTDRRNMRFQGELLFKIIDGLSVNGQFVYETERRNVSSYSEADSYVMRKLKNMYTLKNDDSYTYLIPKNGGKLATENVQGEYWTIRGQLNFQRTFATRHAVDFLAGLEFRETRNKGTKALLLGYDDRLQSEATVGVDFPELESYTFAPYFCTAWRANLYGYSKYIEPSIGLVPEEYHRYASAYANVTYTYDNRLNAFASFRKDFADLFGANAKFRGKPLWSVGASWNINNEAFMQDNGWINSLKLRVSYGKTGNIYQGATSYMTGTTGKVNDYTLKPQAGINSPANPNLKWEKTATINAGMDFSLFGYRLRGSLDYYFKKGTDIFSLKSLDVSKGFTSMNMNMADMKNNGIEIMLAYDWYQAEDANGFAWTTSFTGAYNKNKITYMEVQATAAYELVGSGFRKDYPTSALFSYRYSRLDDTGQPLYWTGDGREVDFKIMREGVEALRYSGQTEPKYNVAMGNTLRYKGFSFNFMTVYYGGHKMRAHACLQSPFTGSFGPIADYYADSWTPENVNTHVPGWGQYGASMYQNAIPTNSDIFVQPADFIKIRNITLGYDVSAQLIKSLGIDNLQLRFQIDNLPALWKKNKVGVDPETLGIKKQMTYIVGLNFNF